MNHTHFLDAKINPGQNRTMSQAFMRQPGLGDTNMAQGSCKDMLHPGKPMCL